jgi:hypothetical protein
LVLTFSSSMASLTSMVVSMMMLVFNDDVGHLGVHAIQLCILGNLVVFR